MAVVRYEEFRLRLHHDLDETLVSYTADIHCLELEHRAVHRTTRKQLRLPQTSF